MDQYIRRRKVNTSENEVDPAATDVLKTLSKEGDGIPAFLETALKGLPDHWKKWCVRNLFGLVLIAGFSTIIYGGPISLMFMLFFVELKTFYEIVEVGCQHYNFLLVPWFRTFCWYFVVVAMYFFLGEMQQELFRSFPENGIIEILLDYHRIISLALYLVGFIFFILSLDEKKYRLQFIMFGWIHLTLLALIPSTHFAIDNLFDGAIWVIVPIALVTCNDIIAYTCGFFFGRTQLIKVSPKKTWEGFIGGGIVTIVVGWFFSGILSQFPSLVCPSVFGPNLSIKTECEVSSTFLPTEYVMPELLQLIGRTVGITQTSFQAIPFQLHSLIFSVFGSLVAPFGGFFASGLKRAFNVKDFGNVIPGHGGILDRCDCQFLTMTFVHIYMTMFIRGSGTNHLIPEVLSLRREEQLRILEALQRHLS